MRVAVVAGRIPGVQVRVGWAAVVLVAPPRPASVMGPQEQMARVVAAVAAV
jgi:hypothetical protein